MKVSPSKGAPSQVIMRTSDKKLNKSVSQWWKAGSDKDVAEQLVGTAAFLKESQGDRQRKAALYARLYGNMPLYSFLGTQSAKMETNNLPADRPTFNLVQSAIDTLVARISQSRPAPVFLTDNADYKERNLAEKLNNFIQGEFYQTKAYEKATTILRDALVEGTGCIKVYETEDNKVGLERRLLTDLMVDPNEAIYGEPRTLYEVKLVDRDVLAAAFPKYRKNVTDADTAVIDNSAESSKTVSDLVLVVEGWRLPSSPKSKDGRHTIACSAGLLLDEEWTKDKFPFVFLHYSPRMLGFFAQGLAEQLMGTQMEINSLLFTITKAIKLVGVPRIFMEKGAQVNKAAFNNEIGTIITFTGTKPEYQVAPCVPQELYAQLQRLIDYGYQQSGVSALQASSTKPAGLNSGEAIRSYDDISTDRFATLARRYDNLFIDLSYQIVELATEIAEREGKYQTIFPDKNGTKSIDLPKMSILKNPFVIQCFNMSSLPKDPAGRLEKVTEMVQAGMISLKEGRRLLDYPDLQQVEKLANAAEERILQILDRIVEGPEDDAEDAKVEDQDLSKSYSPPDPFMDLDLATELTTQYINLYSQYNLEEEKMEQLRTFFTQVQALKQAAMAPPPGAPGAPGAPPMPGAPGPGEPAPQAAPMAPPQSPLIPNAPAA